MHNARLVFNEEYDNDDRKNQSKRSVKLRRTLAFKGNNKVTSFKKDKNGKLKKSKLKGKDLLKRKKQNFKNKFDKSLKMKKVRRARMLRDKGLKA